MTTFKDFSSLDSLKQSMSRFTSMIISNKTENSSSECELYNKQIKKSPVTKFENISNEHLQLTCSNTLNENLNIQTPSISIELAPKNNLELKNNLFQHQSLIKPYYNEPNYKLTQNVTNSNPSLNYSILNSNNQKHFDIIEEINLLKTRLNQLENQIEERDLFIQHLEHVLHSRNQLVRRLMDNQRSIINPNVNPIDSSLSSFQIRFPTNSFQDFNNLNCSNSNKNKLNFNNGRSTTISPLSTTTLTMVTSANTTGLVSKKSVKTENYKPKIKNCISGKNINYRTKRHAISGESSKYLLPPSSHLSQIPRFDKSKQ